MGLFDWLFGKGRESALPAVASAPAFEPARTVEARVAASKATSGDASEENLDD